MCIRDRNISVERIDLRFPLDLLVRGVQVVQSEADAADVQHPDTLLNLGSLNVSVQAWPLLQGRVEAVYYTHLDSLRWAHRSWKRSRINLNRPRYSAISIT